MPIPTGALINVTYRGTLFNQRVMTTMSWKNLAAEGAESDFNQLEHVADFFADDAAGTLLASYLAILSNLMNVDDVVVQELYPVRSAMITRVIDLPGTIDANPFVPNLAVVVSRKTQFAGRDQISNLHVPGIPTATEVIAGTFDDDYLALVSTFGLRSYSEKTVPVTGANLILNGVIINAPTDAGLSSTLHTHSVNPRVRVMRRRTVGLGI